MRLCTFVADGCQRIGFQTRGDMIADTTLAYTAFLNSEGNPKAYQLANALVPPSMLGLLEGGDVALEAAKSAEKFAAHEDDLVGPRGEQILYNNHEIKMKAPIPTPPKILCTVANNKKMFVKAADQKKLLWRPPHPLFFVKSPQSVIGPGDAIELFNIGLVHVEVELALVIHKRAKWLPKEKAFDVIAGYTIFNDVTAAGIRDNEEFIRVRREKDRENRYTGRYKSYDTFGAMGPWLLTKDEVKNPMGLAMTAKYKDDKMIQRGSTDELLFRIPEIIEWMSHVQTLVPGTLISTGTCSFSIPIAEADLRKTDEVVCEIEGLGVLRNPIKVLPYEIPAYKLETAREQMESTT